MYNVKISQEEKERIASGNVAILLQKLEESDKQVTKALKRDKQDNIAHLQGVSSVIDILIAILKRDA